MHTLIKVSSTINFYFIPRITHMISFIFMGIAKFWGHYVMLEIYIKMLKISKNYDTNTVLVVLATSLFCVLEICESYGTSLQIFIKLFCRLWQRNILKPSLQRSMSTKPSTLWRSSRFVCYQQCCVSRMEWL